MITVACVKAKPAYNRQDVERLRAMVKKHLSIPHRFVCLTDDSSGMSCTTKSIPAGLHGWWGKMALYRPGVLDYKTLYLDLDTLIVDSLDFVEEYTGEFAILRDFYRPEGYGSGVMLWNKPQTQIWDRWNAAGRRDHPLGDQGVVEQYAPGADRLQDLWPGKFVSFKEHCQNGIPEGAAVISMHGWPKIEHFDESHWVKQVWKAA